MSLRAAAVSFLMLAAACGAACSQVSTGGAPIATAGTTPSTATKTLMPHKSWECYMPGGIPVPEKGTLLLEAEIKLDQVYDVGKTPFGRRQVAVTQTGTMKGPKIEASVMTGGLDFHLELPNGVVEAEQILVLRTSDNRYAIMRNVGTGVSGNDLRVVFDFEAPNAGTFAWLNTGKFVGRRTIDAATKTMKMSIYDVSSVTVDTAEASVVRINKPADVPPQPWDFRKADASEKRGEMILTEIVTLGGGQQIATSKRGARNVLPITGGTLTGPVSGKVLLGGADYQSPTTGPAIDARYLWQTTEGDIIIVRNAGGFQGLVPTFETRVDGKYAWLNNGKYLSSSPGMGAGGLSISMYKSQ